MLVSIFHVENVAAMSCSMRLRHGEGGKGTSVVVEDYRSLAISEENCSRAARHDQSGKQIIAKRENKQPEPQPAEWRAIRNDHKSHNFETFCSLRFYANGHHITFPESCISRPSSNTPSVSRANEMAHREKNASRLPIKSTGVI